MLSVHARMITLNLIAGGLLLLPAVRPAQAADERQAVSEEAFVVENSSVTTAVETISRMESVTSGSSVVHAVAHVPSWAEPLSSGVTLISATPLQAANDSPLKPAKPFLNLDAPESEDTAVANAEVSNTDLAIRFVTWTAIILGLCVLTVLGIRKWQRSQGILPLAEGNSRVLETVIIGPNRSVSLVQLRGLQAVVGCDASGIQSIVLAPPSFEDVLSGAEATEPDAQSEPQIYPAAVT